MTGVDTVTGEIVEVMDLAAAEKVTRDIKAWAGTLWLKIEEAHRGRAWLPLGYETWESYLDTEFDISRSRGYHLVSHAQKVRLLADAAGVDVSTAVDIPERHTRSLDADAAAAEIAAQLTGDETTEQRVDLLKRTTTEHYETDAQRNKRQRGEVLAAIAADPEASNDDIAARTKAPLIVVIKVRGEIDAASQSPPTPPGDEDGAGSRSANAPDPVPDGADEADEDMSSPSADPEQGGEVDPSGDPPPAPDDEPEFDPVAYRDRGIKVDIATRAGLLELDPDLPAQTDRRPEFLALARDVIAWGQSVEATCSGRPNLRSAG